MGFQSDIQVLAASNASEIAGFVNYHTFCYTLWLLAFKVSRNSRPVRFSTFQQASVEYSDM